MYYYKPDHVGDFPITCDRHCASVVLGEGVWAKKRGPFEPLFLLNLRTLLQFILAVFNQVVDDGGVSQRRGIAEI